jgi:hypothetical protein
MTGTTGSRIWKVIEMQTARAASRNVGLENVASAGERGEGAMPESYWPGRTDLD